jgi:hypothetical protein
MYTFFGLVNLIFNLVEPIGIGLGFKSRDIGFSLSLIGIVTIVCQIFVYPIMCSYFRPFLLFRASVFSTLIWYTLFPILSSIIVPNTSLNHLLWPFLILTLSCKTAAESLSYTSILIIVPTF